MKIQKFKFKMLYYFFIKSFKYNFYTFRWYKNIKNEMNFSSVCLLAKHGCQTNKQTACACFVVVVVKIVLLCFHLFNLPKRIGDD